MSNKEFFVRHGLVVNNTVLTANVITSNVGIGTNNAAYTLDVIGNANISLPQLFVAGSNVLDTLRTTYSVTNSAYDSANSNWAVQNSVYDLANTIYASSNSNWTVQNLVYATVNANYVMANANYDLTNAAYASGNSNWQVQNALYDLTNTIYASANSNWEVQNLVYATVNASYTLANAAYANANALSIGANTWANTVGVAGNNYTDHVGLSANTYASILAANNAVGSNNWANTIGIAGNNYTDYVGLSVNTYTSILSSNNAVGANTWANTVGFSVNNYASILSANNAVGANAWANTVGTAGNNYTDYVGLSVNTYTSILAANNAVGANNWANTVGVAGNNYTDYVGLSVNTYTSILAANNAVGANAWSNSVATAGNNYTNAVGLAGNNYASILSANNAIGANAWANTIGTAGNNYTDHVGLSANSYAGYMSNSANIFADATYLKLAGGTITGDLSITGNVFLLGNATSIAANNVVIKDPLIYLAANNDQSDILDIGFVGSYSNGTANLHTGLFRDHDSKQYYLFNNDASPDPTGTNEIVPYANGMINAVLNADLLTSNIFLGGANAIHTISGAFDKANAAYNNANVGFAAANAYSNATGLAGNNYTNSVGAAGNSYMIYVATSGNTYAGYMANSSNGYAYDVGAAGNSVTYAVGNAGNSYTQQVGTAGNNFMLAVATAGNNYSVSVGASSNAWANAVGVAGNNYTNYVGDSVNSYASILASNNAVGANGWANTVGVAGNNYTNAVGASGNSYTQQVGTAGNNYTDYVGLSSNTYASILSANNAIGANAWSNTVGIAGNNYTNAVGIAGNNYTDSVGVSGNSYTQQVGLAGNNYTNAVGTAGNNYASILVANNSLAGNNYTNSVGAAGNNYTNTVGSSANNWANTKLSNGTVTLDGSLTTTGTLQANSYVYITAVDGTGNEGGEIQLAGASNYTSWSIDSYQNNYRVFARTGSTVSNVNFFHVLGGGSVRMAVNKTDPAYTIDVVGDINVTGTYYVNGVASISMDYAYANSIGASSNSYTQQVGTAGNNYTNAVGTAANNYMLTTTASDRDYTNTSTTAANNYSKSVGTAGNSYALVTSTDIGTAGNNYTNYVGTSANSYTQQVGIAGNNYTNSVGSAGNSYALTTATDIGTAGNNYTNAVGAAGNSYAQQVGAAANAYTSATYYSKTGGLISGDVGISGNLTISGEVTYANTQQLQVGDNIVTLNADLPLTTPPVDNAGIEVNRGSLNSNAALLWIESAGRWSITGNNAQTISTYIASNTNVEQYAAAGNSYAQQVGTAGNNYTNSLFGGYSSNTIIYANTNGYITSNNRLLFLDNNNLPVVRLSTPLGNSSYGLRGFSLANNTTLSEDGALMTVLTAPGNFRIYTYGGAHFWDFTLGGGLSFPDGSAQGTAYKTITYDTANNAYNTANAAYDAANIVTSYAFTNSEIRLVSSYNTINAAFAKANNALANTTDVTFAGNLKFAGAATANNGFLSLYDYKGPFTDGIVVDYVNGIGRISVGANDALTFYNHGVGNIPILTLSEYGFVGIGNTNPTYPVTISANGAPITTLAGAIFSAEGSENGTVQLNLRNAGTSPASSGDLIVTADDGDDVSNYIDLGINGSNYAQPGWTINGARDGYLYSSNTNLAIGTANTTAYKSLSFFVGGTLAGNEVLRIQDGVNGANVGIGRTDPKFKLDVIGTINASNILINGAPITATGGASVNVGATAPSGPSVGNLWWDTNSARMYIYYYDGDSSQWVDASPTGSYSLPNTSVIPATYGGATQIPVITIDGQGRINVAANVAVQGMDYAYANGVGTAGNNYAVSIGASVNTAQYTYSNTRVASVTSNSNSRIWANTIVDGSSSKNVFIDLATSGVTAASYGSSTNIPVITVDAYGRVTYAANIAVQGMDYAYANNIANSANAWANTKTGGGAYVGNNGQIGSGFGDIFRVHSNTLSTNAYVNTGNNAIAAGPITIAVSQTLTINAGATVTIA